jgi:hypothetical protein
LSLFLTLFSSGITLPRGRAEEAECVTDVVQDHALVHAISAWKWDTTPGDEILALWSSAREG